MKLICLTIIGLIGCVALAQAAGAADHQYVGSSQCEDCHGRKEALIIIGPNGQRSNPMEIWKQDPHRKAFDALESDWGKQAAKKVGLADGQADGAMCLKCHTTGAGSDSAPDPTEGVSCEACHGAASDWVKKNVHGEIGNDPAKMAVAVAAGMLDLRKMAVRQSNCENCHIIKRPCYRPSEAPFSVHLDRKFKHWQDNIPVL